MLVNKGFTLIEIMILIAIIGIIAAIMAPMFTIPNNSDGSRCKFGMKYDYNNKQIIGPNGGGIPCDSIPSPTSQSQPK